MVEGNFGESEFERELPVDDPGLAFIAALIGAINIILLFLLLLVYISSYRKLKSSFSLGLVFFALLLIMQNAIFIFFPAYKRRVPWSGNRITCFKHQSCTIKCFGSFIENNKFLIFKEFNKFCI